MNDAPPSEWIRHDNGFFYSLPEPGGVVFVFFECWEPGQKAIWLDIPNHPRPQFVRVADDISIAEMLECIRWRNYSPMKMLHVKLNAK